MKKTPKPLGTPDRARMAMVPLLVIALAAVIGLSITACGGDDEEKGTPGLVYELVGGTYTITGFNKSSNTVIIPATYKGVPVTSIGMLAFDGCGNVTSISIPGSITEIGRAAFKDCTSLTSLPIPGSVRSIGQYAFNMCIDIASITIPASVTSMGDHAFYQWGLIKTQTIYIQGHTSQAAADSAWGGSSWRDSYNATFVYREE